MAVDVTESFWLKYTESVDDAEKTRLKVGLPITEVVAVKSSHPNRHSSTFYLQEE